MTLCITRLVGAVSAQNSELNTAWAQLFRDHKNDATFQDINVDNFAPPKDGEPDGAAEWLNEYKVSRADLPVVVIETEEGGRYRVRAKLTGATLPTSHHTLTTKAILDSLTPLLT
jgi:hypothetical protein